MKNINFTALAKAMERLDDSDDGMSGRCGNWELGLGGYDHGYEIYYRGAPIGRVNYELREYELYDEDFIPKDQIAEFLAAIDARRFKDVGYHEGDDEDFDDDGPRYVQESRKQIMWAVNFRNMRTAVHGMYYGKDKRRVQKFAREMDRLTEIEGEYDPEEIDHVWDDFFAEYPDIQMIEEFNYRDIVDLPDGYEGVEIGDTIYKFVNRTSIDLYYESTRKPKMKFKKIVKEADEGNNYDGDTPKIYVGTYAKYNDGSIDGKWITISDYNTYEEFVDACRELHSDEDDPEFMVQDYENFPEKWYHEGGLPSEEEFDKINEFYMMDDDEKGAYEAYVNYTGDDDFDNFQDAYQGHFDSPTDFAYDMVESLGWNGVGQENIDMYFDYDSFGRDLMYDFHIGDPDNTDSEGNPEDPDHYYDNDGYDEGEYESDTQVAEDYIENIGGVDQLGQETMQNYFDYEAYGRDLLINDFFEEDGYIFRRY